MPRSTNLSVATVGVDIGVAASPTKSVRFARSFHLYLARVSETSSHGARDRGFTVAADCRRLDERIQGLSSRIEIAAGQDA